MRMSGEWNGGRVPIQPMSRSPDGSRFTYTSLMFQISVAVASIGQVTGRSGFVGVVVWSVELICVRGLRVREVSPLSLLNFDEVVEPARKAPSEPSLGKIWQTMLAIRVSALMRMTSRMLGVQSGGIQKELCRLYRGARARQVSRERTIPSTA